MKLKSYLSISTLIAISLNLSACFERPKSHTSEKPSNTIESILDGLPPKYSAKDCAPVVLMEGIPPQIQQAALNNNTRNLCFEEFALKHSGISKGPIWVAEYLSPEKVAKKVKRQGEFHAETRLPAAARAPKVGPPIYSASAPWLMASIPNSRFLAGASNSSF